MRSHRYSMEEPDRLNKHAESLKVVCGNILINPGLIGFLQSTRFQIPFGIPGELYEIPAGVGPLILYMFVESQWHERCS